jgi:hypothetical protein
MEVSNETLQLGGSGLVRRWNIHMSTIMCFCMVYGSTAGHVTSMRNFGGVPEKFGAFGISRDALLGSCYVYDIWFCICQVCNVISLVVRSGGLIGMIYRVAIALLNKL